MTSSKSFNVKNKESYLQDTEDISQDVLPTLMDFETIYYYKMKWKGDDTPFLGQIKCKDIVQVELLTDKNHFGFLIDYGHKKYEFSTQNLA